MGYGYGPHWGMMGWGNSGFWPFGMIIWTIIIVGFIALLVWAFGRTSSPAYRDGPTRRSAGLDVLEERYARGEISREEYLQKKSDIAGG